MCILEITRTPVGTVNLIRMVYLLKFLHYFRNTPVPVPNTYFNKLDSVALFFVWAWKFPRLAKSALQPPLSQGGLSLPNFQLHYWVGVQVTVRWLFFAA